MDEHTTALLERIADALEGIGSSLSEIEGRLSDWEKAGMLGIRAEVEGVYAGVDLPVAVNGEVQTL